MADKQSDAVTYKPIPTVMRFHQSAAEIRILCGPVATGKTAGLINDMKYISAQQEPYFTATHKKGKRHTKFCFVRDTQAELKGAVIDHLSKWIDESILHIRSQPDRAWFQYRDHTGCLVRCDIDFVGMDTEASVRRLKSRNYTVVYLNEGQYSEAYIRDVCFERSKRFPLNEHGVSYTYGGLTIDCNPPKLTHWIVQDYLKSFARDEKGNVSSEFFNVPAPLIRKEGFHPDGFYSKGWTYYKSPTDEASHLHHIYDSETGELLRDGINYWIGLLQGYTERDIKALILGEMVGENAGKPIYGDSFNAKVHISDVPLKFVPGVPVRLSFDWGHHAACVVSQYLPDGRWGIMRELYGGNLGLDSLLEIQLGPLLRDECQGNPVYVIFDPSDKKLEGAADLKQSERVAKFLRSQGVNFDPVRMEAAETNQWKRRNNALTFALERNNAIVIDPRCDLIIDGMLGEYVYPPKRGDSTTYQPGPNKESKYSHIFDCVEYEAMAYMGSSLEYNREAETIIKRRAVLR